ncbi:MAG: aminodeoxychorismate synthase component I [Candidatus Dormibacteria bacterium]
MPGSSPERTLAGEQNSSGVPFARFDNLASGEGLLFEAPSRTGRVLVANAPTEVMPVLQAVDEAAAAGWWAVGFVTYEATTAVDPALTARFPKIGPASDRLPLAWFGLFGAPRAVQTLEPGVGGDRPYTITSWQSESDLAAYRRKFEFVRDQLAAGDIYQCNLTTRMFSRAHGDMAALYRDLALAQGGAYNAYLDTGRFVIASASPELFFEWSGDRLTTKPMKGTAARGRWLAEDRKQAADLAQSAKDRAENVMIVDLLRNDLGKVAEWGSVQVTSLFDVERYETVWQLTSTVTARPRPGTSLVDVFRALFPCASVTGAPKWRAMSLIAQLEESPRGVYCGAVGVVAPPGAPFRARFNVAIRTVLIDRATGEAVYGTGGGITWDSTADSEHAELMAKATVLHRQPEEFCLVETMGFRPGRGLRNRERHLARLADSASYFGFSLDLGAVRSSLGDALADTDRPCRVRLILSRSGARQVELAPMPRPQRHPVALVIDSAPLDSGSVWLYHKTTRRGIYQERAARHPEADDVILVNERAEATETTVANLAVRLDGRWWTPPVDSGCLPGIQRARLLERGQLTERVIASADLYSAEGIALVSSLRGWRRATLLGAAHSASVRRT